MGTSSRSWRGNCDESTQAEHVSKRGYQAQVTRRGQVSLCQNEGNKGMQDIKDEKDYQGIYGKP